MAFPWQVLEHFSLADGNIVEDMQLSVDLCLAGRPPRFCPTSEIRSSLPGQRQAAWGQRKRWEHGHLATILSQTPRLLWGALRRRDPLALGMMLDLFVPPLSMLVSIWAVTLLAAVLLGLTCGNWLPALLLGATGGVLFSAILAAWVGHAQVAAAFGTVGRPLVRRCENPALCGLLDESPARLGQHRPRPCGTRAHLPNRRAEILDN